MGDGAGRGVRGGSYSYGTNNENHDIDFRGVALQRASDLLGRTCFEQFENRERTIFDLRR